jgi:hypothetical protein
MRTDTAFHGEAAIAGEACGLSGTVAGAPARPKACCQYRIGHTNIMQLVVVSFPLMLYVPSPSMHMAHGDLDQFFPPNACA